MFVIFCAHGCCVISLVFVFVSLLLVFYYLERYVVSTMMPNEMENFDCCKKVLVTREFLAQRYLHVVIEFEFVETRCI